MTQTFTRGKKLLRFSRGAVLAALAGLLLVGGVAPAAAAPDTAEDTVSTVRVDASQWDVTASVKKPLRAEAADFPSGDVYCTSTFQASNCFKALTGKVDYLGCGAESGGGDVSVVVRNRNRVQAPRDISVFVREGDTFRMVFGDRDWAERGRNVVQYRGLPAGTYLISVGWDDQEGLTFFGNAFTVDCP